MAALARDLVVLHVGCRGEAETLTIGPPRHAARRFAHVRWQLAFPEDTPLLRFDDGSLVFNPATWETHLLNDSATIVLAALVEGPRSADEIVAEVVAAGEVAVPDGFAGQVVELLGQLESLRLVTSRA